MTRPVIELVTQEDLGKSAYLEPDGMWLVKHHGRYTFGTCSPYKPHKTPIWTLRMAGREDVEFNYPPKCGRILEKEKVEFIGRITINGEEVD